MMTTREQAVRALANDLKIPVRYCHRASWPPHVGALRRSDRTLRCRLEIALGYFIINMLIEQLGEERRGQRFQ
jgi:hypothetical protein